MAAELARLRGKNKEAQQRYLQAAGAAERNDQPQLLGLAYRLAAQHHAEHGESDRAEGFFRRASEAYGQWGALALAKSEHCASSTLTLQPEAPQPDGSCLPSKSS